MGLSHHHWPFATSPLPAILPTSLTVGTATGNEVTTVADTIHSHPLAREEGACRHQAHVQVLYMLSVQLRGRAMRDRAHDQLLSAMQGKR